MADAPTVSAPAPSPVPAPVPACSSPHRGLSEWLLWLLLALMTFSLPKAPGPDLDPSWRMALPYFLEHGYAFGRDAVFTYGPLGFLLGRTYTGELDWALFGWQIVEAVIVATLLLRLSQGLRGTNRFFFFAFFLLFGLGYEDALQAMVIVLVGWSLIRQTAGLSIPRAPAAGVGLLLALLAAIKFTNLLLAGYVIVVVTGFALHRKRSETGWWLAGTFAAAFVVIWSICGQPIRVLPEYLWNSLDISAGYDAQMGLPTPAGPLWKALVVVFLLAAYAVWHLRSQADRARSTANLLILGAFLFLEWKHAFVRADGHMLGFFYSAMLVCLAFPALLGETAARRWIPRCLLVPAAVLSLAGIHDTLPAMVEWAGNVGNERIVNNLRAAFHWPTVHRQLRDQLAQQQAAADLPKTRATVGQASLDVIGFEQGVAMLNRLNYVARPVFQSYQAYTPHLAKLNAEFLTSKRAPEYLLVKLQAIDERPPLADDAQLMQLLPFYYRFVLTEKGFQLWHRRPNPPAPESLAPRPLTQERVALGRPLPLGEMAHRPLWVAFDVRPSLLGRIRNFVYKPALVQLRATDEQGKVEVNRLPLVAARGGFLLNPIVTDLPGYIESQGGQPKRWIRSLELTVAPSDRRYFQATATVTFSAVTPAAVKAEYEQQLMRAKYAMFSEVPDDVAAFTNPSEVQIDGRPALVAHAPSVMVFSLAPGVTQATGRFGYVPGAYEGDGNTDGGEFRVIWVGENETRVLFSRLLQPKTQPKDRGLQSFAVDLRQLPPGGRLKLEVTPGPNGDHSWDWTAWTDVVIK